MYINIYIYIYTVYIKDKVDVIIIYTGVYSPGFYKTPSSVTPKTVMGFREKSQFTRQQS